MFVDDEFPFDDTTHELPEDEQECINEDLDCLQEDAESYFEYVQDHLDQ